VVEDWCKLVSLKSLYHINVGELMSARHGIEQVVKVRKSIGLEGTLKLTIMVDNTSTEAWLLSLSKEGETSVDRLKSVRTKNAVRLRLEQIRVMLEANKIELEVLYVQSAMLWRQREACLIPMGLLLNRSSID